MRQVLTRYAFALALLALPSVSHAAVIGTFQWVDCTANPPFDFEAECGLASTIFRLTNISSDVTGIAEFPDAATSFHNARILVDGVESNYTFGSVLPFDSPTIFADEVLQGSVTLALTLDPSWSGVLTLPTLTAANGPLALIDFVPTPPTTPVPESSSLLLVAAGLAVLARRRHTNRS